MEKNYPSFNKLLDDEKKEIRHALNQAASSLLLQAWNKSCRMFLDYLKKSKHSPFQFVDSLFARHKFQASIGNLPHIHAMLCILWHLITVGQKKFLDELVTASLLDIVRVDNAERLIDEGVITDLVDGNFLNQTCKRHITTLLQSQMPD